jgi:hypothetical protein
MRSPRHHPKALWCGTPPGLPTAVRRSEGISTPTLHGPQAGWWASVLGEGAATLEAAYARESDSVLKLCPPFPQAPDMSSSEEFPSFGAQVAPKTLPWGPKR